MVMLWHHQPISMWIKKYTEIQEWYYKWQILKICGHLKKSKMPSWFDMTSAIILCGFNQVQILTRFIPEYHFNARIFVDMKFIRGERGLNFISIKTRVYSNLCHVCIRTCNIEPCCDKCDMPHITVKRWPLIGQKWTTVV